jgi:hypothetical protein
LDQCLQSASHSDQPSFERWTKALEDLKPREAFVKLRGKTVKIRTRHVPRPRCTLEQR